ncbi:hypothetical protein FOXYSP1_19665 [Fusarium oxysporum f. sp. phaseoli]
MEDSNEHTSLPVYLGFIPELGPDVLSNETIAHQKDDLTEKLSPESRRQVFCGVDSRAEVPHICLDEDEKVSDDAGITFDVKRVVAFPSNLAVAKRGIRWSPTRMTVSDLQSGLHLRSIPVICLDTNGKQHQVHRPVHQIPHYTFGRVVGFEDISLYLLFPTYIENRSAVNSGMKTFGYGWMAFSCLRYINATAQPMSSITMQYSPAGHTHLPPPRNSIQYLSIAVSFNRLENASTVLYRNDVIDAILDVTDNHLSQHQAAQKHGMPQTTLSDRLRGLPSKSEVTRPAQLLYKSQEAR